MKSFILKLIVLGLLATLNHKSRASVFDWTGAGADSLWSTSANWSPSGPPTSSDDSSFGSVSGSTTPTISAPTSIFSITFASGASTYDIGGSSTLTIANGVVNNSSANQTLSVSGIALSFSQTWNANTGNLSVSSAIDTGTSSAHRLTVSGSQATSLSGDISGLGGLTRNNVGSGTLTLSGNNSYAGTTVVTGGTLVASTPGALGNASSHTSAIQIFNAGLLRIDATPLSTTTDVTLFGGTFQINNVSSSWGVLANSSGTPHLDLTAGDSSQTETFSSATRGSGVLTVDNWSNVANRDRILITATPDSTFLNNVNFTGFGAGSMMSGNELVPAGISVVPEPREYAAFFGIGLLVFGGLRRRLRALRGA